MDGVLLKDFQTEMILWILPSYMPLDKSLRVNQNEIAS